MMSLTRIGLNATRNHFVKLSVNSFYTRCECYTTNGFQHKTKTVDEEEIRTFSNLSDRWWHLDGEFKALHSLNKLRVPFVRDGLLNAGKIDKNAALTGTPLKGLQLLDIGCGGGILTEPLGRLGADVVGLDASQEAIETAEFHAAGMANAPKYVCETIEDHANTHGKVYDAIILSEVLEHIRSKDECLRLCAHMIKPQGSIFITTINRTVLSWMGAILAAEYLLHLIPPKTHQWEKFISPCELQNILRSCGCSTRLIHGMFYDVLCNKWRWTSNTSINFALHAIKITEEVDESVDIKK